MTVQDQLETLNPAQREAAGHVEGPLLVLAGAGSGKTRVLTTRVALLIDEHGVAPERILAVTFTNKAASEMRERIERLLGEPPAGLWAGTFHAFGAWLLRRHAPRIGWSHRFTIHDADETLSQVQRVMDELGLDRERWRPRAVRGHISDAKSWLLTPEARAAMLGPDAERFDRVVQDVYEAYQASMARQDAFDFDDLLMKAVELLRDEQEVLERYRTRFGFILVDEYQDTNHAQYRMVQLLAQRHRNLMVVGDDDQSIYGWRGADVRNILEFEEDFEGCRTVRLERNYRSTGRILAAANEVIRHNRRRKEKTLFTDGPEGEPLLLVRADDDAAEARWIADTIEERMEEDPEASYRDFAILYRTNAQSRALEDAIRRRGMPYQIVGGLRFYERREIRDVLAYLRLIANPRDRAAFERAVRWPRRGVGEVTRSRLLAWAREEELSPVEASARATRSPSVPTAGARSLEAFGELIGRYRRTASELPAAELLRRLIDELDLLQALKEEGPEGEERAENVEELVAAAAEIDERGEAATAVPPAEPEAEDAGLTSLDRFLQEVALVADVDRHDPEADAVLLMTLHNSKGLEFPWVFLAGMEEGLCPHARSAGSEEDLEEERRLFYVGLTRARRRVVLTHAASRRRYGRRSWSAASSFLRELPEEHVREARASDRGRGGAGAAGGDGRWSRGDAVIHPRFGEGTILEVAGSPRDPRLVVAFEDGRTRRLIARYAELEPASG